LVKARADEIKRKTLEILRGHPEGLTIADLSRILKAHRQTITKYVFELKGADIIFRRRIGAVTLHYLKERYEGSGG